MGNRKAITREIINAVPKKQCCNCGCTEDLRYHHIIPLVLGGNNIPSNIAVVCADCHSLIHYGEKGIMAHDDLLQKGREAARKRGVKFGRKNKNEESVVRMIAEHSTQFNDIYAPDYVLYTEKEIMSMANLKPTQYSKYKRMLIDAMKSDVWPYEWNKPTVFRNMPLYDRVIKNLREANLLDYQKAGGLNG